MPGQSGHALPVRHRQVRATAQSRCAPARCAGAGAERPVAGREDANSRSKAPSRQFSPRQRGSVCHSRRNDPQIFPRSDQTRCWRPRLVSAFTIANAAYLDNGVRVVSARQKLRLYGPRGFGLPHGARHGANRRGCLSDIFVTANSLKSYARQKLLSPFSNNRAETLKLCGHSRLPVFQNHAIPNPRTSFKSP